MTQLSADILKAMLFDYVTEMIANHLCQGRSAHPVDVDSTSLHPIDVPLDQWGVDTAVSVCRAVRYTCGVCGQPHEIDVALGNTTRGAKRYGGFYDRIKEKERELAALPLRRLRSDIEDLPVWDSRVTLILVSPVGIWFACTEKEKRAVVDAYLRDSDRIIAVWPGERQSHAFHVPIEFLRAKV